jgi:AAA family ATP:ADP antiporter
MAAGISTGGLVGPALGILLVGPLGVHGLLVIAAVLLLGSALAAGWLQRWRDAHPVAHGDGDRDRDAASGEDPPSRRQPLGGHPFAGIGLVLRSRYLLGIAAFVVLLASVTTFLYFEQARLVELHFPDRAQQVRVFGVLDFVVQALALATQLFLTGRLVRHLGLGVLLVTVPLAMAAGFVWLAFAPTFAVFALVMIVRRAGEYALARPGREMLFTVVVPAAKYKAKNVIDSAVYRGADAVSAWVRTGIDAVASHPAMVALAGAVLALAWAACGWGLARGHARRATPG